MNIKEIFKEQKLEINEMAKQHFRKDTLDLIAQNDIAGAVQSYIDNHGSTSKLASSVSTTIKNIKKDLLKYLKTGEKASGFYNNITMEDFLQGRPKRKDYSNKEEYISAINSFLKNEVYPKLDKFEKEYNSTQGIKVKEKKAAAKTKEIEEKKPEEIKSARQSKKAQKFVKDKSIEKIESLIQDYEKIINNENSSKEAKDDAKSGKEALEILLQGIEKAKGGTPILPPKDEEKLKERYKKIGIKIKKKAGVNKDEEDDDPPPVKTEEDEEKEIWKKWLKEKKSIKDLHRNYTDISSQANENYYIKYGKLLAEGFGYEGAFFWENYIISEMLKGFSVDVEELGLEETTNLYIDIFGEETKPLFKNIYKNYYIIEEAIKSTKSDFLFETYTLKDEILNEGPIVDVLRGVWNTVKNFGAPIIKRLRGFITKGFGWAKELATKGLAWIGANPIARVAVPAVAVTGGLLGAIKLINRVRKKKGKGKMSKNEKEKLIDTLKDKKEELKKAGISQKEIDQDMNKVLNSI